MSIISLKKRVSTSSVAENIKHMKLSYTSDENVKDFGKQFGSIFKS